MPLFVDDCREPNDKISTNVQDTTKPILDHYRQELVLSYLSEVSARPMPEKAEVGRRTRVLLFPDHSAMLVCSITVWLCVNVNSLAYIIL